MSMDNQMIGRRGEKHFSLLCSEAGVTCNKSVEDDFGWDMLIEFPARPQPMIAIDMQQSQTSASVQIKATTGESRSVSISLSNALRYARTPLPTFVVLVVLGGDKPRYFIKHIWTPIIGTWLKAAREVDSLGFRATNKETITLSFEDADEQGDRLLAWMEHQISDVAVPYAGTKAQIVDTIGFGRFRGTAEVTFTLEGPHDLLDLQLGLKPHIDASRFTFTSERFGLSAGRPEIDLSDIRMIMTPEGSDGILRLEFPNGDCITVPAKVYSADDGSASAWRVATQCLDITYGPHGRVRARAGLKAAELAPIEEIALFAKLKAATAGVSVQLELDQDGKVLDLGSIAMEGQDQRVGWSWLGLSIDVLRSIGMSASRPLPKMKLSELNAAASELEMLSALASERLMRLDFRPERGIPRRFESLLAYCSARVGDYVFAAVARRPIIYDKRSGKWRKISFGSPHILYGTVVEATHWSREVVRSAYTRQLDRLAEQGEILALGDIADIVAQGPGDKVLKSDLPSKSVESGKRPRN